MAMEISNTMGGGAVKGFGMQMGQPSMDSFSKNIQSRIANKQKEMQELAKAEDMSVEDKLKKRQEIQKEITDLNQQLRQHRIEKRKEQQTRKASMDDMLGGSHQTPNGGTKPGTGMSSASMQAIISADVSLGQIKLQSSVKTEMKGRAAILQSEIEMDKARGADTQAKEAELEDAEKRIDIITSSQLSELSDVDEELEEAAKEDDNGCSD